MTEATLIQSDVCVVSAYGRGHWLASALAERGLKTSLIDLSGALHEGRSMDSEDAQGPFGLFESADLLPSQVSRWTDEGSAELAPEGFTLWLNGRVLELHGNLTSFHLKAANIAVEVETYLRNAANPHNEAGPGAQRDRMAALASTRRKLQKWSFNDVWLAHFAHDLCSNRQVASHGVLRAVQKSDSVAPILAPYRTRHLTEGFISRGLASVQKAGVEVVEIANLKSIVIEQAETVDAIRLISQSETLCRSKIFVWLLDSHESERLAQIATASSTFFARLPQRPIASRWLRARLEAHNQNERPSSETQVLRQLPNDLLIVEDLDLPWVEDNFIILKRLRADAQFDVWMRVASEDSQVVKSGSIETRAIQNLQRRVPGVRWSVRESLAHSFENGLVWPLFERGTEPLPATLSVYKNLFLSNPAHWSSLDDRGRFQHQAEILARLEKIKSGWDAEELRRARQAAAAAAKAKNRAGGAHP